LIPWEYGPMAFGALEVETTPRVVFTSRLGLGWDSVPGMWASLAIVKR
jgi:hypothetical protein